MRDLVLLLVRCAEQTTTLYAAEGIKKGAGMQGRGGGVNYNEQSVRVLDFKSILKKIDILVFFFHEMFCLLLSF